MSGNDGNGSSGGDPLKTATAIVGLLAGVVAVVYVLGGLVIALRLFFDAFAIGTVVAAIGQLPRELVIGTAMLDVLAPAAVVGIVFGLLCAAVAARRRDPLSRPRTGKVGFWPVLAMIALTALLVGYPVARTLIDHPLSFTRLAPALLWPLITFAAVYAGWYALRLLASGPAVTTVKLAGAAGIAAAVSLAPALLLSASLSFAPAQVCVSGSQVPVKGELVGEGGGQVLLAQSLGREAGIVSLPSSQVMKIEYGDILSSFTCPVPAGVAGAAKVAEAKLDGHGGEVEDRLASELRPRLRFDSHERWRPVSVESFVGERFPGRASHQACWRQPDPRCEPLPSLEPVPGLEALRRGEGAPEYIEIAGSADNGSDYRAPRRRCREGGRRDCNDGRTAVIYYRRTSHEGRWYWDYWWFFRYNDYSGKANDCTVYCADHEGDWEGITVITTPSLKPEILGAIYAAHNDRILVDPEVLPRSGTHTLAFVAEGTHATYPFRCSRGSCRQFGQLLGFRLPEEGHDGEISWGGNDDAHCKIHDCVRPLPEIGRPGDTALPLAAEWAGWPGKWGSDSSPRSPGLQTRFKCPWAPTRWARLGTDGTVSESVAAGDAERVRLLCEAQRGGL